MIRRLLLASAILALAGPAGATLVQIDPNQNTVTQTATTPATVTGVSAAATITSTSAQLAAAGARKRLAIDNESTTASIACRFGGVAALNTAGSYTIPPMSTRTWNSYPVPTEVVNCISSAATSPATYEVN